MKMQTELAVRSLVSLDGEVGAEDLERAISILRGTANEVAMQILRRKDVMELLHIKRRTLDYYLQKGYLDRAYAGKTRALGVTMESYRRFIRQAVVKREGGVA